MLTWLDLSVLTMQTRTETRIRQQNITISQTPFLFLYPAYASEALRDVVLLRCLLPRCQQALAYIDMDAKPGNGVADPRCIPCCLPNTGKEFCIPDEPPVGLF